jgi:hypothetical protein
MTLPPHPLLVVSYTDDIRAALTATLKNNNVASAACSTFCEAETLALQGLYSGILVDLPSIVKSKGEEKIVAYTLTNFFPTLRVRALGSVLVPMTMPGSVKQDKNLDDFLNLTCPAFAPRKLRAFKRHTACLATIIKSNEEEYRGFTLNLGWGGAFIVDVTAEKFFDKTDITVFLPEFTLDIGATIRWIKPWGERYAPGIGISFNRLEEPVQAVLAGLLRSRREFDRDRLVA